MTTPPARYNEASLLLSMETAGKFVEDETLREAMKENGIGRPSSRAGIIETLLKRGYIIRDKKKLISTQTGRDLVSIIEAKMLKSPELTGQWEKKLRDIEHGTFTRQYFMDELQTQLVSIIKNVQADTSGKRISAQAEYSASKKTSNNRGGTSPKKTSSKPASSKSSTKIKEGDKCPLCGKGYVRKSLYGGLYCSEYKNGCKFRGK